MGRYFAAFITLGAIFFFLLPMLETENVIAQGATLLDCREGFVALLSTSTNDPPGRLDPGFDINVAECLAQLQDDKSALVEIRNGYPGYECSFTTTIYNRGDLPVCLESVELRASPALSITGTESLKGTLLKPHRQIVHTFTVHILQQAISDSAYHFRISERYKAVDPGKSATCRVIYHRKHGPKRR